MRNCIALVVAVAALAACQTMTESPAETGLRSTHALRQEPHRAAVCVARNLDAHPAGFTSRIREGTAPGLIEVHVTRGAPVALVQFVVRDAGSTAAVTTATQFDIRRDEFIAAILAGC